MIDVLYIVSTIATKPSPLKRVILYFAIEYIPCGQITKRNERSVNRYVFLDWEACYQRHKSDKPRGK